MPASDRGGPRRIDLAVLLDCNAGSIEAGVRTRGFGLHALISALPDAARPLAAWIPDIGLRQADVSVAFAKPVLGLYAEAGLVDDEEATAGLLIATAAGSQGGTTVAGLVVAAPIDLGETPLFGPMLAGIGIRDIQLAYASNALKAGELKVAGAPAQPAFAEGINLSFVLFGGGEQRPFRLSRESFLPDDPAPAPAPGPAPKAQDPAPPAQRPAGGPAVTWFDIHKTIGPLDIGRIGVAAADQRVGLALDAGLTTTVLTLVLKGFVVTLPTDGLGLPDISIDALELGVSAGNVRIDGSLLRAEHAAEAGRPAYTEYAGSLLIKAGAYGIAAIGAYASYEGAPSLFVFGVALGPFGGPPAFQITGIAAGFGFNRTLNLPPPERVAEFPFIRAARDEGGGLTDIAASGWIPPRRGSYWLAAGLQATSFELVKAFAVVSVEFGEELVVALLGIASIELPDRAIGSPYLSAELTLSAVLRPREGTFKATALLTNRSYVLHESCHLTGGFAFWLWFPPNEEHPGDFVLTLGGYHPAFDKPDWYPDIPRVGIDWRVSDRIQIRGGAYFALTPSCAMAGGALSLTFSAGDLKAWCTAHADMIFSWRPFWFDVSIGVSIGASYHLELGLISRTLTVELGADLHLWGPPVRGVAHVKWLVISFTIEINGGGRPEPQSKVLGSWDAFAATFLPKAPAGGAAPLESGPAAALPPADAICRLRAADGLLGTREDGADAVWLVSGARLALAVGTAIPATAATAGSHAFDGLPAAVHPLGNVALAGSPLKVTLRAWVDGGPGDPIGLDAWDWAPVHENLPASLWGPGNDGEPALGTDTVPALTGLTGTATAPEPQGPPALARSELDSAPLPAGALPVLGDAPRPGSAAQPDDPRAAVRDALTATPAAELRERVAAAFGLRAGDLAPVAERLDELLVGDPVIGPLGTTGVAHRGMAVRSVVRAPAPAAPAPRSMAAAPPRPRAPRLRAVAHRRLSPAALDGAPYAWLRPPQGAGRAYVDDRHAGAAEAGLARGHVAPHRGGQRTALAAGGAVVWRLDGAGAHRLVGDGALPLRIVALDAAGTVVLDANGADAAIPEGATVVAAAAGDDGSGGAGWYAATALLQLAPHVLLGHAVLVRSQAPVRVPARRRRGRASGLISGARLSGANLVLDTDGRVPGWLQTTVPDGTRTVVVGMRREDHAPVDPGSATAALAAGGTALDVTKVLVARGTAYLVCAAPGDAVVVRPAPGWRQDALLAFPLAPDALLADRPGRGLAATADGARTEVVLR
jgi:hypothetical protein